jgi:hypothetical protein
MAKGCNFTAIGKGVFPIDMLRYDRCFPSSSESATWLSYRNRDDDNKELPRKVALTSDTCDRPTEARWNSFGWKVT